VRAGGKYWEKKFLVAKKKKGASSARSQSIKKRGGGPLLEKRGVGAGREPCEKYEGGIAGRSITEFTV